MKRNNLRSKKLKEDCDNKEKSGVLNTVFDTHVLPINDSGISMLCLIGAVLIFYVLCLSNLFMY